MSIGFDEAMYKQCRFSEEAAPPSAVIPVEWHFMALFAQ